MKKQWPFYLIVFALFLILISPKQWADGMFFDGMLYASISRNMAIGLGYIWKPYGNAVWTMFYEHPPFALWLESLLFRLIGDSIYVERIYSFLTFLLAGGIMILIWRRVTGSLNYGWLPLLLWIIVPTVSWACSNNMLENTMMVFTTLSVYFYLRKDEGFYFLALSGLSIFLAVLSKGVFGLFVLAIPLWMWVWRIDTRISKMIFSGIALLVFSVAPFFIVSFFDNNFVISLKTYWFHQVVGSVQNIQTVDSRFSILGKMLNDLLPSLLVVLVLLGVGYKNKRVAEKPRQTYQSWSLVFLCLGLSGVFPIMVSLKQSSFYILATFPVFSLAFALYILPIAERLVESIKEKGQFLVTKLSVVLFMASIIMSIALGGRIGRDHEEMKDMYATLEVIPRDSIISISKNMGNEWHVYARYYRYGQITVTADEHNLHHFFLIKKEDSEIPDDYVKMPLKTLMYDLYKKME
jgi:4-amino-4-deoxy-L-arabinose transferase-like glycosyltransferase